MRDTLQLATFTVIMIHSYVHMSVFLCSENRMFCIPSLANNTWNDKSSSSSGKRLSYNTSSRNKKKKSRSLPAPREMERLILTVWSAVLCKIFKVQEWALCPFMGSGVEEEHKSVSHNKFTHSGKDFSASARHSECFLIQPYHYLLQCQSLVWLRPLVIPHSKSKHLTDRWET